MFPKFSVSLLEDPVEPLDLVSSHANFTLDIFVLFGDVGVFLKFSGELADVESELIDLPVLDFVGIPEFLDLEFELASL